MNRFRLLLPLALSFLLIGPAASAAGAVGPKVVRATQSNGVTRVANLDITTANSRNLGYRAVTRRIGKPGRRKGGGSTCYSVYGGAGLTLLFTSFGGARSCAGTWLQTASVWKRSWRVRVGRRTYRVGMRRSHTPSWARRVPGFGYQVASDHAFGRRIGTVFLRFNKRDQVASISLWIGAAGD